MILITSSRLIQKSIPPAFSFLPRLLVAVMTENTTAKTITKFGIPS